MPNIIHTEYNSQREPLIISEYGRGVQDMIERAKAIENPQARQRVAEIIVEIMRLVNPQKNAHEDVTEKLWKHFFRIAKYEIDVKPPFGEAPKGPDLDERPGAMPYPVQEVRFRHYGHNIQVLVRKALEMEPGTKRDELVTIIGSYMKLAYKTWNREHYVSDDLIKNDLVTLSGHKLSLEDHIQFDTALAPVTHGPQQGTFRRGGKYQRSSGRNRHGGGSYGNKGRRRK